MSINHPDHPPRPPGDTYFAYVNGRLVAFAYSLYHLITAELPAVLGPNDTAIVYGPTQYVGTRPAGPPRYLGSAHKTEAGRIAFPL